MRIEKYECAVDSGGAGLNRGGNGINMVYHFLENGTISIHDDRWFVPPWGVNGGQPGARSWKKLVKADGQAVALGSKMDRVAVERGDELHYVTWGGGGWGDPLERDPAIVGLEVRGGLVSVAGARDYGVVCDEDGVVDAAATDQLRNNLRAGRDDLKVFEFGPSIEKLRQTCLADTGLPAPIQPVWRGQTSDKIAAQ
jgi:N-methylhydantoinase B